MKVIPGRKRIFLGERYQVEVELDERTRAPVFAHMPSTAAHA